MFSFITNVPKLAHSKRALSGSLRFMKKQASGLSTVSTPTGDYVYVNGEFTLKEDAKVSPFDRGYLFGDGVYEVVPVVTGKLVDKQYMLDRLEYSLGELGIPNYFDDDGSALMEVLRELVRRNKVKEGGVYLSVTRGVSFTRSFSYGEMKPSLFAFTFDGIIVDSPDFEMGLHVVSTRDLRWKRRDAKTLQLLGQVLSKQTAVSDGADEGWMIDETDGTVTEGTSSSAWIVKDGVVITRPLDNTGILPGIRRRTMLEVMMEAGIPFEERNFTLDEALEADEAMTSSAGSIFKPVVSIDGHKIGEGVPGPVAKLLRELYLQRFRDECEED